MSPSTSTTCVCRPSSSTRARAMSSNASDRSTRYTLVPAAFTCPVTNSTSRAVPHPTEIQVLGFFTHGTACCMSRSRPGSSASRKPS